ncbi:MAG: sensor histidine kinase, partial [Sulfurimonas sp.]|nr:sensor histidine kinase [Sulfurimonas sp.]
MAYECLSAIGNSLELESMMYEVLSTFSRKTGAIAAEYYLKKLNKKPYAYIGKNINFDFTPDLDRNRQYMIFQEKGLEIIIIPLKNGYLKFIYKDQENIKKLAAMLGNFQKKIDLSINACHGVKEMEKLNEDLEDKVDSSIKQIRKNEKIIIAQSKQAVMGEMMEMIAHQWRQPITAIGMISNNITMDIVLDTLDKNALKNDLDSINAQVNFLSTTIDDFRNFFKESTYKESVSSKTIIESIKRLVFKQLKNQNIFIEFNECKEVTMHIYKNELIQVLLNLISNSKDALLDNKQKD